jgi:hypothetical protein
VIAAALALVFLMLSSAPLPAQTRSRAFAVHEIRLGMPLREFRALDRFAELREEGKQLFCSDEPPSPKVAHVRPAPELVEAGAIACRVLPQSEEFDPEAATVEFFGEIVSASFTFYKATGQSEPRLTQMLLDVSNERFERLLGVFRRSYGQPARTEVDGGLMISGAQVSNATYQWYNATSSIRLDMYSINVDRARAIFIYNEWWDELLREVRRIRFGG